MTYEQIAVAQLIESSIAHEYQVKKLIEAFNRADLNEYAADLASYLTTLQKSHTALAMPIIQRLRDHSKITQEQLQAYVEKRRGELVDELESADDTDDDGVTFH